MNIHVYCTYMYNTQVYMYNYTMYNWKVILRREEQGLKSCDVILSLSSMFDDSEGLFHHHMYIHVPCSPVQM